MSAVQEELQELEEDTQKEKYLTFLLGKEVYAIEIKFVTEIVGIQPITEVPELPPYVKGIINLRGKIITVMDVRLRFKKDPIEYNDRTCVVVVDVNDVPVGLIVDNVSEVLPITDDNVVSPPNLNRDSQNKYLKGIGKVGNDVKLILDCNKLMQKDESSLVSKIA
jgi:purine-binding chemotaxis protein CheW